MVARESITLHSQYIQNAGFDKGKLKRRFQKLGTPGGLPLRRLIDTPWALRRWGHIEREQKNPSEGCLTKISYLIWWGPGQNGNVGLFF